MKPLRLYRWFQLSSRQRMSPFPNYLSMEAICTVMKRVLPRAYSHVIMAFQGNTFYLFMDSSEHVRLGEQCTKKIKKDPLFFKKLIAKVQSKGRVLLAHSKKVGKESVVKKMTNAQIAQVCDTWVKLYKDMYAHYFPIIVCELYFAEALREILGTKPQCKNPTDVEHAFTKLTKEYGAMVARKEEEALLALAVSVKKPSQLENIPPVIHRRILKHVKQYYWVTRDYQDPIMSYADVVRRLKDALQKTPALRLSAMKKDKKEGVSFQKRAGRIFPLSRHEQALFQAFRDGVYLKELRKKFVSQSLTHWDTVLNEISRRSYLTVRQARFLKIEEVHSALNGKDFTHIMNQRIEKSLWWCHPLVDVRTGKEADAFFKKYIEVNPDQKSFTGTIASSGRAKGTVRIVMNPADVSRVRKGDVLVTVQAVPSMAPAFRNAAAVIADGGTGVTSHTATLAREVSIPAITGTRIATRLLHDGDVVEVDAVKGIVTLQKP